MHLFLFLQMVHQFCTLVDLATKLREGFLSVEAMKQFVSTARCAAYPDVDQFERERDAIEQSWPAFASDASLSRAPAWAFDLPSVDVLHSLQLFGSEWLQEGLAWERQYKERLQHTSSRMNHHIHPICNSETGERRPLASCTTKAKPKICRSDFPLDTQICEEPLFVCACVAEQMHLCVSGARSMLGCILPKRNSAWLNAGPTAWVTFCGDNGDIKFPQKLPIIPETHERGRLFWANTHSCCAGISDLHLTYQLQAAQAMAAGYFGGYSAKMQDVGFKEIQRMEKSLNRNLEAEKPGTADEQFRRFSKRLLRDLEAKGIIRTSLEGLNLAAHADNPDPLRAECFRTFPTVAFPATQLLRREEIETGKRGGTALIVAVHHRKSGGRMSYSEAPFDLLYGFRGSKHNVDLLSPFEMIRFWSIEKV